MIQVFLSYARADGLDAATRLRGELAAMGFVVWRDIEEMRGGLAWKKQLHQALTKVNAVLVLLTPGAVASSNVTWEWQTALVMDKRVIPLLISPCEVPDELKSLQYHDLSAPSTYALGLARVARDLIELTLAPDAAKGESDMTSQFSVGVAVNSAVGVNPVVVNQAGAGAVDATDVAQIIAALRGRQGSLQPEAATEFESVLTEIHDQLDQIASGVNELRAGQVKLLARFDESEQHILRVLLTRLGEQEVALIDSLVVALDSGALAADEVNRHLDVIEAALDEVIQRASRLEDRQLVKSTRQVAELAGAPGLDAKHKLKLTLPIVPAIVAYEGEIELNSRLNLEETWRALRRWITRNPPTTTPPSTGD